jgi:hypothetical protein
MKKIFNSKIGLELVIPLVLIFGTVLVLTIMIEPSWIGIVILLPVRNIFLRPDKVLQFL